MNTVQILILGAGAASYLPRRLDLSVTYGRVVSGAGQLRGWCQRNQRDRRDASVDRASPDGSCLAG